MPVSADTPPTAGEGARPPGRFVRAAAYTYATNLLVAAFSLVNVLIISRALGPEGRGDVAFLLTVTLVTATLASFGIHQASANLAGTDPASRPALATNAFAFSMVHGALAIVILVVLIAVFPAVGAGLSGWLLALALAAIPMMIARIYYTPFVTADYGFGAANAAWLIGPAMNVAVNGTMAIVGDVTVASAVIVWIIGQALGVGILVAYVHVRLAGYGRPNIPLAWRSFRFGVKAHPGNVMLVGNYRMDQWITGSISGATELGLYSVAVAWAEGLFFLPTALANVQRPDVVRSTSEAAARRVASVFRAAVILTVPLAVALFFLAPFLCGTVFGPEFAGAARDLRLLIPGGFGIVALKVLGSALTAQGRPTLESVAIGVSFVTTLALDIALIPRYGGEGAAMASSIAYCLGGVVVCVVFVRALGGSLLDLVPRPSDAASLVRPLRDVRHRRTTPTL
jgi:O-antigen/teichoic acid export membrane protein